ncbi:MAG: membrane protein insertase YidC [Caldisericia bacterium]|nr:membrane protein insertase YidC [Caldisericia bacterium]
MKRYLVLLGLLIFILFTGATFKELDLKITTSPIEKKNIGDNFYFELSLKNLGEEKKNLIIQIESLSNFSDFGPFELLETKKLLDSIKKDEEKKVTFNLRLKEDIKLDEYTFLGSIEYEEGGLKKFYKSHFPLKIVGKGGFLQFSSTPNVKATYETLIALSVNLKNTGNSEAREIKVKIKENDYFTEYITGKNTYLESLQPGKNATFTLRLKPNENVTPKSFNIPIMVDYKDASGNEYNIEEGATINIVSNSFVYFVRRILDFFYGIIPNYGIAIIFLTLLIKLIILPFTIQQIRNMSKTQMITPELQAIQKKYKDDPRKAQEEQMKLYKKYGINPTTGCLMSILPLPILLVLFSSLNGYVKLLDQKFLWINNLAAPDPTYLIPILVALTTLLQQWVSSGKDPNARIFMIMFPILIAYWALTFPSAISIYWIFYSIFSTVEYFFINKRYQEALSKIKK